jgi:hypothetical protein
MNDPGTELCSYLKSKTKTIYERAASQMFLWISKYRYEKDAADET